MSRLTFLVKVGRGNLFPFNRKCKTVAAFDTTEEAEAWIMQNLQKGQHMYIEPVEKISKDELEDLMKDHTIVNIK